MLLVLCRNLCNNLSRLVQLHVLATILKIVNLLIIQRLSLYKHPENRNQSLFSLLRFKVTSLCVFETRNVSKVLMLFKILGILVKICEIWSRPSLKYMFGNGYGSVKTLSLQQNWIRKILSCAVSLINKATISFFGSGV